MLCCRAHTQNDSPGGQNRCCDTTTTPVNPRPPFLRPTRPAASVKHRSGVCLSVRSGRRLKATRQCQHRCGRRASRRCQSGPIDACFSYSVGERACRVVRYSFVWSDYNTQPAFLVRAAAAAADAAAAAAIRSRRTADLQRCCFRRESWTIHKSRAVFVKFH